MQGSMGFTDIQGELEIHDFNGTLGEKKFEEYRILDED